VAIRSIGHTARNFALRTVKKASLSKVVIGFVSELRSHLQPKSLGFLKVADKIYETGARTISDESA